METLRQELKLPQRERLKDMMEGIRSLQLLSQPEVFCLDWVGLKIIRQFVAS